MPGTDTMPSKQVSFCDPPAEVAPVSDRPAGTSASSGAPSPAPKRQPLQRRRSSLKEGAYTPFIPPKELYQHPDPLIRRLRLRDAKGKQIDLEKEFRDVAVVAFLFGCVSLSLSLAFLC